jgi:hypothetical protein
MSKLLKVTRLDGHVTSYKIAIAGFRSLVDRYKALSGKSQKNRPVPQKLGRLATTD